MARLKIGQVNYINCLPVYHALEEGLLNENMELVKGPPALLNKLFLAGELDVTPISSIEYARHNDRCIILPNLSISADGKVESILFFSRLPIIEMEGKRVCVTTSSATSVALLRILFEYYYHVHVEMCPAEPNLDAMMESHDGALLIGDDAMQAHHMVQMQKRNLLVTDLGEAWKDLTGEKMVYAVWAVHSGLAESDPETIERIRDLFLVSRAVGLADRKALVEKAHRQTKLPRDTIKNYLETIHHDLGPDECRALTLYFDYAYKSGLIDERIKLNIWGE